MNSVSNINALKSKYLWAFITILFVLHNVRYVNQNFFFEIGIIYLLLDPYSSLFIFSYIKNIIKIIICLVINLFNLQIFTNSFTYI